MCGWRNLGSEITGNIGVVFYLLEMTLWLVLHKMMLQKMRTFHLALERVNINNIASSCLVLFNKHPVFLFLLASHMYGLVLFNKHPVFLFSC